MDFGMISYEGLTEEDFTLPEMPQPFLPGTRNRNPLLYLGLPNWNYKEEEKKKNSPDPQPGTLPFYASYFNACELVLTHEEVPAAEKIMKWYKSIEAIDFKFCPQFHKGISNTGKVDIHKLGVSADFMNRMKSFQNKLGSSLLQLPENYAAENSDKLVSYLEALPKDYELAVELRNPDWFANPTQLNLLVEKLNRLNKTLVITDTPGRRDTVHMQLSNTTAFIRLNAKGWNELDLFRVGEWKKRLQSWYLQGLEKCYFFLHIHDAEGKDDFINYVQEEFGIFLRTK